MFNYNNITDVKLTNNKDIFINFIIPVRNRLDFSPPMFKSFDIARKKFKEKYNLNIEYTLVEHDYVAKHRHFASDKDMNYIFIKNYNEFNKCLSYNAGVIKTRKSKYYIFHDIDCIIKSDFFNRIYENLINQKCDAMQCFQKRRVLNCDIEITNNIIFDKINFDDLSDEHKNIIVPINVGAPGGSILMKYDLFFDVGGYDDDIFSGYSPEDIYMWEKIITINNICLAENPPIDIFHMYHKNLGYNNPYYNNIYNTFRDMKKEDKINIIKEKSKKLKKYKHKDE